MPTTTLDTLIEEDVIRPPQLIKIDVEGAEAKVLRGAARLLAQHRPIVLLATHGREVHQESCHFFRSLGYRLSALDGSSLEATDEVIAE